MAKGTVIYAPLVPPSELDEFPTHLANLGAGGLHSKPNIGAINAIKNSLRNVGMLAFDINEGRYYMLHQTEGWVEVIIARKSATNPATDFLRSDGVWATPSSSGMLNVSVLSELPTEGIEDGSLAYVKEELEYFKWSEEDGTWFKVSILQLPDDNSLYLDGAGGWSTPPGGSQISFPFDDSLFLNGMGQWETPPVGTVLNFPNNTTKFLRGDNTWQVPPAPTPTIIELPSVFNPSTTASIDLSLGFMFKLNLLADNVTLSFSNRRPGVFLIRLESSGTSTIVLQSSALLHISGAITPGLTCLIQIIMFDTTYGFFAILNPI